MRSMLLLFVLAAGSFGQDKDETIRVPRPAQAAAVTPKPDPSEPIRLKPGQWLVIEAKEPVSVLVSPEAAAAVTDERAAFGKPGPLSYAGVFADTQKTERRSYEWDHVYSISAAADGPAELLVVGKTSGKLLRVKLLVDGAGGEPLPGPQPQPKPAAFTAAVKAAYDSEKAATKRSELQGLLDVYKVGVREAAKAGTWGDLFADMADEAKAKGVAGGKLPAVQAVIAAELKKTLPSLGAGPIAIPTAARVSATAEFNRVIAAIEEVLK
jgi:hypothetical protein